MMRAENLLRDLSVSFPEATIHWRPQNIIPDSKTGKGHVAMALGYIDARHVMDRLDQVCGTSWQNDQRTDLTMKTQCGIGIKIDDEWIWRWDGAGELISKVTRAHFPTLSRGPESNGVLAGIYTE